ncbi:MAG: hypothetical protein ACHQK8_06195 [Bacteroidia bacterium]
MKAVLQSLEALVSGFHPAQSKNIVAELSKLFTESTDFLKKVKSFDSVISIHPEIAGISDYIFDLMMMHHLSAIDKDDDYFDSKEWLDIEDKTLERGTELLNLLLYISESKENDIDISLTDFLYEFLLVDEDEFQDEHRIYEDLIANEDLVEEGIDTIQKIATEIVETSEIRELFTPVILFFQDPREPMIPKELYHKLKPEERGVLSCLRVFYSN